MSCRVVCISHATGAGGEEVGRMVAETLGFPYVDDEIVAEAAASAGIGADEVAAEERRRSLVARLLDAMAWSGADAWTLGAGIPVVYGDELTSDDLRALIRDAIRQTAERGDVVIVAHGASHHLGPGPGILRVLVTASADTRTARLAESHGLDDGDAARAVKESDAGRRDYLKRFYEIDEESPAHYDLVVNTDVLSIAQATRLIALAAS
jgi:cytidylate kinase